jgi:hypothetical protein
LNEGFKFEVDGGGGGGARRGEINDGVSGRLFE